MQNKYHAHHPTYSTYWYAIHHKCSFHLDCNYCISCNYSTNCDQLTLRVCSTVWYYALSWWDVIKITNDHSQNKSMPYMTVTVLRKTITPYYTPLVDCADSSTALKLSHLQIAVDAVTCTVALCHCWSAIFITAKHIVSIVSNMVAGMDANIFKWFYFPIKWGCI